MALNASSPMFNYKFNLGESSLLEYINKSAYEEIKQEQETNEILAHLRMKYLPNSVRSNSFNKSMNMTYFQRNNSNKIFSPFSDKISFLESNNFPKSTHASFNKFNLTNNRANIKTFNEEKMLPYSLLEQKEPYNLGESIKLNKENVNNERLENNKRNNENSNKDDYLRQENKNLKNMSDVYKIIISILIDYINNISNTFIGKNTLEMNYINNLIKACNSKINYTAINNLKAKLKTMENSIINFNTIKKSQTVPLKNVDKDILNKEEKPIIKEIKEKNGEKQEYKPIIFERNKQSYEKISKSVDRGEKIKKAKTWFDRLPKTYWSLNKKIKFRVNNNFKV
jgi:hypothetical protein